MLLLGATSGVFGRNAQGKYFTIMTGRTDLREDETTGLAFSPDAKHMYVSYQGEFFDTFPRSLVCTVGATCNNYHTVSSVRRYSEGGWIYDCTRDDKRPFNGATLGIKYHAK
jgi:hypothetical protein